MATREKPKQLTTQYVAGSAPPATLNRHNLRTRLDQIEAWCASHTGEVVGGKEAHLLGICAELAGAIRFLLDHTEPRTGSP